MGRKTYNSQVLNLTILAFQKYLNKLYIGYYRGIINKMKYILGSRTKFIEYLDSIKKNDKVGIISHNDLDGIASAVFMTQILRSKNIKTKIVRFMNYKENLIKDLINISKEQKINKLFITDLNIDSNDQEYETLKKSTNLFLIDHHPISETLKNKENIIKSQTDDCASLLVYDLGKGLFEREEWNMLLLAAMIADFSFKNPENLELIRQSYPEVNLENIRNSEIGIFTKKITYAILYHKGKEKKVYKILLKKDQDTLEKYYKRIDNSIKKQIIKFKKNAEFHEKSGTFFYFCDSKYDVASLLATEVSLKQPKYAFIIISEADQKNLKVSARNQGNNMDMNLLLKKGIEGLGNSTAGGHKPASGANFLKIDLDRFKQNIISMTE